MKRFTTFAFLFLAATANAAVSVTLDTSEADAVLRIANEIAANGSAPGDAWTALFATAGYRDLKSREAAFHREFTDDEFKAFVSSDVVVKNREALRKTLAEWRRFDMNAAAARALSYLPAGSSITATIYPLIKPKPNSFVFRLDDRQAIFLYLDPEVSGSEFENTVVHEMHHIGFETACSAKPDTSTPVGLAQRYLGGFGEGIAVLAATGSAKEHPHAASDAEKRATWDRDVRNVARDMKRLETFFLDVAEGRLPGGDEVRKAFMSFIATDDVPQGAFYTVGWHMASTIEKARGRDALLGVMCDRVAMMRLYNEVVAKNADAPKWSAEILKTLDASPSS
jgi:hypothetical protein